MAVRIRKNGQILCAAINKAFNTDCYIDDGLHYELSVIRKILVTTEIENHINNKGEWYWKDQIPPKVSIDKFYLQ